MGCYFNRGIGIGIAQMDDHGLMKNKVVTVIERFYHKLSHTMYTNYYIMLNTNELHTLRNVKGTGHE